MNTMRRSARSEEARGGRNRGRRRRGVDAVNRQWRRGGGVPGSRTRRGCRGGPGAPSGPGNWSEAAWNSGNGAAKLELGFRHFDGNRAGEVAGREGSEGRAERGSSASLSTPDEPRRCTRATGGGAVPWRGRGRNRGRRPGDGFAQNPLGVLFFFCSGPFSILISVLLIKHAVN